MVTFNVISGSANDVPLLHGLWLGVHGHHQRVMPDLAPYVDDATSWSIRSSFYRDRLGEGNASLVLASDEGEVVGYGFAVTVAAADTWMADTWKSQALLGEIETLAVEPERRGQGIGTALFRALEREMQDMGVTDLLLGCLPGNVDAVRLYESLGFRPTWTYLTRRS